MLGSQIMDRDNALSIAERFQNDEWSPSAACDHYVSRIQAENDRLQAFVDVFERRARRQARDCEQMKSASPLCGVPIAIKDANAIRGTFMRLGSTATQHFFTPVDDILIARLRRAGLVFLGKTTMPEFGVLPITEPRVHPPTRNPYNVEITAGGSSGGSAVAVAAGLAPIALGSDGGGSIRIPAAFCGLVGFKPSRGLVTNPFGRESPHLIWTCGPIARSVRDAAALLDVLIDPGPSLRGRMMGAVQRYRSGWPFDNRCPSFMDCATQAPRPLRIRWTTQAGPLSATPEIHAAVERAAKLLAAAGHQVEQGVELKGTSPEEFLPLWQATIAQSPVWSFNNTEPLTRWLGEPGRRIAASDVAALNARIAAIIMSWFGDVDVWLTPTVAVDPPSIGAWKDFSPRDLYDAAAHIATFTAVFNVTGQPAVSLPAGFSQNGIPIGIQLIARPRHDAELFMLANSLEQMLGFADERRLRLENTEVLH